VATVAFLLCEDAAAITGQQPSLRRLAVRALSWPKPYAIRDWLFASSPPTASGAQGGPVRCWWGWRPARGRVEIAPQPFLRPLHQAAWRAKSRAAKAASGASCAPRCGIRSWPCSSVINPAGFHTGCYRRG
jgi:hypothetical protein